MEIIFIQIMNGIALGSIYSLITTGFNLMFFIGKMIHFSYPYIIIMSMYASWAIIRLTGNLFLALLSAPICSLLIHILVDPLFYKIHTRTENIDINSSFILSLGIAMVLTEIMSHHINYGFPISFPVNWVQGAVMIKIGQIRISSGQLYALFAVIVMVLFLLYILYQTQLGRAFRAMAESITAVQLQGISIITLNLSLYFVIGMIGGLVAILLSFVLGAASPWLGDYIAIKMLAISIVSGLGNLKGGLICGFILGIIESLIIHFFPGSWSNAISFLMMMIVILMKPRGIFHS